MDSQTQQTNQGQSQDQIFVVEISSTMHNVSELPYFFDSIWYVFISKVETTVEIMKPRDGEPKPKEPKKTTTTSVVAMMDQYSMSEVRRYFKVRRLHVFVPYRSSGFTNTMFVPMGQLTPYVKEQVLLAKEEEKHEIKELEVMRKDFEAELRGKLQIMIKNKFFEDRNFEVNVVIQPRKDYAVFAFINFFDVDEYDIGLSSMVLRQQTWDNAPAGTYVESRFSKATPQNGKAKPQNKQ